MDQKVRNMFRTVSTKKNFERNLKNEPWNQRLGKLMKSYKNLLAFTLHLLANVVYVYCNSSKKHPGAY